MNPSVNDPGEQATDKLLFQYLEGELTDEHTRTLEARLAADPALRSELELWQSAFVAPDACDTTALEGRLLKEPAPSLGASLSRWVPDLLLVVALFLAIPLLKDPAPTTVEAYPAPAVQKAERLPGSAPAAKQPVNGPYRAPQSVRPRQDHVAADHAGPAGRLPHPTRGAQDEASLPPAALVPMGAVAPLTPVATLQAVPAPEGTGSRFVPGQPVKKVKVPAPRTLTRRQQRAVARMKRRAIQQRKANEFLKGNIPYVVPLDPNNF